MADNKIHHCANCGAETEDWDELPNGRRIYICGSSECAKEFRDTYRQAESEARERAEEDNYSRYY